MKTLHLTIFIKAILKSDTVSVVGFFLVFNPHLNFFRITGKI